MCKAQTTVRLSALLSRSRHEDTMFRSVICSFALTVAVAAASSAQDITTRGEKVFADHKCAQCHSLAGKGNTKGPLDKVGRLSTDDIRAWITDANAMTVKTGATRKPAMRMYTLPREDVDALIAYLSAPKTT
jgi:mono/diheme cytochrome c family protein